MTLGEKIAKLCEEKNITQKELAKRSGISLVTINKCVNDRLVISPVNISKIAKVLRCNYDELYELAEKEREEKNVGINK